MREKLQSIQFSVFRLGLAAALLAAPVQAVPVQAVPVQAVPVQAANANATATATAKPTLSATVSKSSVQVAESLSLELTVTAPQGAQIALPPVGRALGEFDVIDYRDVEDLPAANDTTLRVWTRHYTLETITTGDLEIPAIEVRAVENGTTQTLTTEPVLIHVASVLEGRADPTQFRDIRSVVDVEVPAPVASSNWVWWTVGGVVLLSLCAGLFLVTTRRHTWLTPVTWAQHELDQLRTLVEEEGENTTDACNELTSIVRRYLEMQFELSAPQRTSKELLDAIENRELLSAKHTARFRELFANADLTKFAGVTMSLSELAAAIHTTEQLVEEAANTIATVDQHTASTAEAA